ncbi:MAG TPA: TetR/AcrR family transcriptional regulator C-terminal domain-containing protein, partial [Pseudonocardiaceae bacterium]|nr:TetR/AcrR family transcriptional regulator C-terminal domain-containing protein [Pseudonocardiaceae bacterium]
QLRPGDRVPSTRQIAQEWGVAIVTATRVLATLRDEGLVVARPRVGTVVAQRARAPRRRPVEPDVTRERIVAAAIAIADADGLGGLSMRRIATELGMATMSIYHYLPGKDELIDAMVDGAFGDDELPPIPEAGWRVRMDLIARLQWSFYRRHPWLADAMSFTRPPVAPRAMRYTEWTLAALDDYGLSGEIMTYVAVGLASYVRGTAVNLEPEAKAEQDTGMNYVEWMIEQEPRFLEILREQGFPVLARLAVGEGIDIDLEKLFEFGLDRFLDGLAGVLPPEFR